MCEQCLTWPVSFGQPLPGFTLMRARRDGNDWLKGEWGLVQCNDPSFQWKTTPTPSPTWGMTDDEEDAYIESIEKDSPEYQRALYSRHLGDFADEFSSMPAMTGYKLIKGAMDKGYDPKVHGFFSEWFFDYLGEWLKTAEMVDEGDPFPERESFAPVDLTIGRDPIPGENDES